jgi:NDP-sugar pyrophosphorylase family protein
MSPVFIITIHHLDKVGKKGINKIQHVYNYVKDKGINTMLLVSISYTPEEVEAFIEANIPDGIEYYYADEKAIETMLRSNPGFILLKESVVLGKWHYNNSGDILNMSTEDIQDLDIMINKNKSSEQ